VPATLDDLDVIRHLNRLVFEEERIINTFDRDDLVMMLAEWGGEVAGFKIGYRENEDTFYSAKGGVHPRFRRKGIARAMLYVMMEEARRLGFSWFAYDTFPNRNPGMTVLGLKEGFRVTRADFNEAYRDYRIRFEERL
jgi:ribosomal protein S18 acetylase RimI-like enzyme